MKTRLKWLSVLALCLTACPPPVEVGDGGANDNEIVVGPNGGLFLRNGYAVNVPAGAFTETQRLFVTITDTGIPEVPGRTRISLGYRLSPAALVPSAPLTLFFPWVEERLVQGVDPNSYDMRRQQGADPYLALPGAKTSLDPVKWVEARTDRLGLFWLTSPSQPNVDRLELDPEEATLAVGATQSFTAKVLSPTGDEIDLPVTWSVAPARVASIDGGVLTALDPGIATVTASAQNKTATAVVRVQGMPTGPVSLINENPFPTGNDLYGGAFAPLALGTAYAGDNGTLLLEKADGSFQRAFSSPGVTFKAVGGTTLTNAVAIGVANGGGVLVELKGENVAPSVRTFQPAQISDLTTLWFDGTHGMGVGTGNQVLIRRNGGWTTEYHPSFEALLSVVGDGAGRFTVVGNLGSIYQWDPVRLVWDSLYDMRLAVLLDAAILVSPTEAWAVGGNRLWHFSQNAWSAESLPSAPALTKATTIGLVDGHIVVGGTQRLGNPLPSGLGAILVRTETAAVDGGTSVIGWTSQSMRGRQVPRSIFGEGSQGRVVGDLGAIYRWDSGAQRFTEASRGFQGDVADLAATSTDLFVAVNECTDVTCSTRVGEVLHRGATGFEPLGALPDPELVHALVARSDDEVVVATDTHVYRWSGSAWVPFATGSLAAPVLDLAWCGNELWGAGANGQVYRGTLDTFQLTGNPSTGPLYALHCPTALEVWVTGTQYVASRQLTGTMQTWTQRQSMTIAQAPWQAVWSPGVGEGFTFGDALFGVYWDGVELQLQQSTGPVGIDVATAMWGTRIDNLYMTGLTKLPTVFGFLLRFDGLNWSLVDPGAHRKGTCLTGLSADQLWLGTEGGGVLRAVK